MIRNSRALGLVLVAALALSAAAASAAQANQANPRFTAGEYPASLIATGTEAEKFTAFGAEVTCKHARFTGTLTAASTEVTVTPEYKECHSLGFAGLETLPVTATTNGCAIREYHPTTEGTPPPNTHWYTLTASVVCPPGKQIEFHIFSNLTHVNSICTLTIGPQTGLPGYTDDVHTIVGPDRITMTGSIAPQVQIHRNSALCPGAGSTAESTGTFERPAAGISFQATNEFEEFIDFDIG